MTAILQILMGLYLVVTCWGLVLVVGWIVALVMMAPVFVVGAHVFNWLEERFAKKRKS